MKKKLPGIFKGVVKNNSQNQKESIVSNIPIVDDDEEKEEKNINRKIKDIFSSPNYVYKANVNIVLTNGETLKKTIIGRTNNSLITIDDELIDVSKISKIDFLD